MANYSVSVVSSTASSVGSRLNFPIVAPAYTETPAASFKLVIAVPNASTNLSFQIPCDLTIIGCVAHKIGVSAAADTVQLFQGTNAITNAISLTAADGTLLAATGIAHAYNDFSAGDILTIDPTRVADCACTLYVDCIAR